MDLGENKTVYTPEQIAITYRLAGLGTRFVAVLLDSLLQGVLLLGVVLAFALLAFGAENLEAIFEGTLPDGSSFLVFLLILSLFTVFWGYFVFWETIWNGQTPGKRVCGIRVMREGGFPIDFRASFVRNIVRIVDLLPSFYGVGAFAVFLSRDSKRLGDYAAGTLVVVDAQESDRRRPSAGSQLPPPPPAYQVLGDPALLNLRALTREQFAVVEHYLSRRAELPEAVRTDLARQIATPLLTLIGFASPPDDFPHDRFLIELATAYRSLSGG